MGASGHIPSQTTSESPGYPLAAGDSKQSPVRQMPGSAHQCPHAAIQMGPVWAYPQTPSRHACRPRYAELLHLWGQGMARAATDNHRVHTIRGPRTSRTEESEELGRPGAPAGHRRGQASVARAVPGCTQ